MTPKNKVILIAGCVLLVSAAMAVWKFSSKSNRASSPELGKASSIAANRYDDWQWGKGSLADAVRPYIAETLMEMRGERPVMRLIASAEFNDGRAVVRLKESVYWSDGMPLEARHVVDAQSRMVEGHKRQILNNPTRDESRWLRGLTISAIDKQSFEILGLKDQNDMQTILSSYWLAPVRLDVISAGGAIGSVTIGQFTLTEPVPETVDASGSIELKPNPHFFRSPATASKFLRYGGDIKPVVE